LPRVFAFDIDAHHRTIGPVSTIQIHCLSFCEMYLPKNSVSTLADFPGTSRERYGDFAPTDATSHMVLLLGKCL
jgi:hypothetical protein